MLHKLSANLIAPTGESTRSRQCQPVGISKRHILQSPVQAGGFDVPFRIFFLETPSLGPAHDNFCAGPVI
jgi:hypothetical protein